MNHNKHYGTIAHWFGEMSRGSIICDESSQRIFANRQSLHPDYQEPETGHRVSFQIETENNREAEAMEIEAVGMEEHPISAEQAEADCGPTSTDGEGEPGSSSETGEI